MSVSAGLRRRARARIARATLATAVCLATLVTTVPGAGAAPAGRSHDTVAVLADAWRRARSGVALARLGLAGAHDELAGRESAYDALLVQLQAAQAARHMDRTGEGGALDALTAVVGLAEAARDDAAALVRARALTVYALTTDAATIEGLLAHEVAHRGHVDETRLRADWDRAPERALDVMAFALAQAGTPYAFAASGPDAYDCSGLTMAAWASVGVHLTHFAATQYRETSRVLPADLAPADLVFFGADLGHVGLYLGEHLMVHAPHTGDVVRVASVERGGEVRTGRVAG